MIVVTVDEMKYFIYIYFFLMQKNPLTCRIKKNPLPCRIVASGDHFKPLPN